jgi:hypothetical protein
LKRVTIFCVTALILCACENFRAATEPQPLVTPNLLAKSEAPRDLLTINSLAILPPEVDARADDSRTAAADVSGELAQAAQEQLDLYVVPSADTNAAVKAAKSGKTLARPEMLAAGRKVGADAVLMTRLLRFTQRSGSAVGVSAPAGIDFAMGMYRVRDGKEVWQATYHYQDEALTDNLFKVRERFRDGKGPGWRSAEDLLADGFRAALKDFSSKRVAQFANTESETAVNSR